MFFANFLHCQSSFKKKKRKTFLLERMSWLWKEWFCLKAGSWLSPDLVNCKMLLASFI